MKNVIPRSARLSWSAEKSNVEQTLEKLGQTRLNMQAVPLAGSISKPPKILPARGTRPNNS